MIVWGRGTGSSPKRASGSSSFGDEPVYSCLGVRSPRRRVLVRGIGFAVGFNASPPRHPLRLEDSPPRTSPAERGRIHKRRRGECTGFRRLGSGGAGGSTEFLRRALAGGCRVVPGVVRGGFADAARRGSGPRARASDGLRRFSDAARKGSEQRARSGNVHLRPSGRRARRKNDRFWSPEPHRKASGQRARRKNDRFWSPGQRARSKVVRFYSSEQRARSKSDHLCSPEQRARSKNVHFYSSGQRARSTFVHFQSSGPRARGSDG